MKNKKYEILIFDLDDTLIDNKENIRQAFKKTLEHMNEDYTEEKFNRWYNLDNQYWLDRQLGKIEIPIEFMEPKDLRISWVRSQRHLIYYDYKITLSKAMELNEIYIDSMEEEVSPIEGSSEVLKYLSTKYKIVIATNGPLGPLKKKLEKINCLEYVSELISAEMFGVMKPEVIFCDKLKEYLNEYDKDKYLMIGDSLKSDIEVAENAEIDSIWFNRRHQELPESYHPTHIINNLMELKEWL